jgi:aminodeoxyfutalosine deaminase
VRTGAVGSLEQHPLPQLADAGVRCSISTDDPAMFDTDLTRDYEAARTLGYEPELAYAAGVEGALCDDETKAKLRTIGESFDWASLFSGDSKVR